MLTSRENHLKKSIKECDRFTLNQKDFAASKNISAGNHSKELVHTGRSSNISTSGPILQERARQVFPGNRVLCLRLLRSFTVTLSYK
jgi:hypothetical protein